ncbi:hypothetical protein DOS48_05000 [Halorubrum sp. PV6]|nr:hypothetical protein DOS48_05000 [Halorubrum sp. PV6]
MFSTFLFIPIVLAGVPSVNRSAITGLFTREEVLLIFFIETPIVFSAFAVYRVGQFYRRTRRIPRGLTSEMKPTTRDTNH